LKAETSPVRCQSKGHGKMTSSFPSEFTMLYKGEAMTSWEKLNWSHYKVIDFICKGITVSGKIAM
jgi:hypothetical protein